VASVVSQLFDAVSGLFLEALGTDMTAMEEYFPFVTKAYDVMQVTAWAILILITIWQLFRAFGGPITEAENPWHLLVRSSVYGLLIGYAKPIFSLCLNIARAPYTTLMELSMTAEDFTFAGVEQTLTNGLLTIVSAATVVGLILILILEIALGWNYFKLLLETVERYIVVGVLCYTSPLAFSMGGSKTTSTVFKSWCRMVGSQLLLLVMNVWFLRGFASSMGQFIANGGALTTGKGSIFLWMFCALAYLKCAQRFDSYLASIGLNVAQTGSSMGMELMMAARVISGAGSSVRSAGSVFGRGGNAAATGTGAAANGFASGFASRFSPNSYVRDAVVEGGSRMGFNGGAGFVGRAFGGIAARNGATLNGNSISSVAARAPSTSGTIAGDIADRSLGNYMPQMQGFQLQGTQITGGHISTTAVSADGKSASVDMFNASQFEKPEVPHSVVTAADGSQWYQMASGEGRGAFYDVPTFHGVGADIPNTAAGDGVSGASQPGESGQSFGETLTHDGVEGHPGMVTYPGAADGIGAADTPAPESTLLTGVAASPVGGGDQPPIGYGNGAPSVDTVYGNAPEAQHFGAAYAGGFGESPQNGAQFADHGENVGQGFYSEAPLVAATFPSAPEGTSLRTVGDGVIEASSPDGGNTLWYNSAYYQEPDAPHSVMQSSNGVDWYAMQQQGNIPQLARPQLLIIRRHSRTLCPVMIFLFLRLMAHTVRTATLKSGTRMALARSSMISPDMPHLVVTIRSSRIPAAVSGTQFRAMPLSTANPSTRTVSLSMTTENSARPMWKPFVTSRRPPDSLSLKSAEISNESPQKEKCNQMAMVVNLTIMAFFHSKTEVIPWPSRKKIRSAMVKTILVKLPGKQFRQRSKSLMMLPQRQP